MFQLCVLRDAVTPTGIATNLESACKYQIFNEIQFFSSMTSPPGPMIGKS